MNDNDKQPGWFTNFVNGFFGLIEVGHPPTDRFIRIFIKLLILFLVLTVLTFAAGAAIVDWWNAFNLGEATSAVGSAFSEAIEQSQPVVPSTDIPVPSD